MADSWFSVTVDLPEDKKDLVESLLYDLGATGLEVRDREAPPMPGVRGPNAGEAIIVGWFDSRESADEAKVELDADHPDCKSVVDEVPTQDWSNNWKSLIKSVQVGALWVGSAAGATG